jgi:hypothetical protein
MPYTRPMNAVPLSVEEKQQLLSQYSDFYRELAGRNPGGLNKKLPRSTLASSLDRIGHRSVRKPRR